MGVLQLSLTPIQQTNPRISSIISSIIFTSPSKKKKEGFLFAGFVNQPGEVLSRRKWSIMKIKGTERKKKNHKD